LPTIVKINKPTGSNPRVLVAPLDWGLGHATRCIPIIKELINQRCEVIIATFGAQKVLLLGEFPSLTFVDLPGYGIKYHKKRAFTILRLMSAIPKILIRIKQESAWLRGFAVRERVDLVISDNRYGLAAPGIFCVLVTHQLLIKTPFGRLGDTILQRMNYRVIRHFSRCWVPDVEGCGLAGERSVGSGLAGELSHPLTMPVISTRYIGWLSRFGNLPDAGIDMDVLVLLSGPEPQRTLLERRILAQAADCPCELVIVRGLPAGGEKLVGIRPGIVVHDHLPAAELERLIRSTRLVIARPGYSTVMDLARLGKRALLIPTPGQSEQEYLGPYLAGKGWAACVRQADFSLAEAVGISRGEGAAIWPMEPSGKLAAEITEVLDEVRQSLRPALG
jgi:UDP-N-acetylglucosamine transferase subunit ALG13